MKKMNGLFVLGSNAIRPAPDDRGKDAGACMRHATRYRYILFVHPDDVERVRAWNRLGEIEERAEKNREGHRQAG